MLHYLLHFIQHYMADISFKSILSHNGPKDLNRVNVPFSGTRKRFRGTGLREIHLIAYVHRKLNEIRPFVYLVG